MRTKVSNLITMQASALACRETLLGHGVTHVAFQLAIHRGQVDAIAIGMGADQIGDVLACASARNADEALIALVVELDELRQRKEDGHNQPMRSIEVIEPETTCPRCQGAGRNDWGVVCSLCGGSGRIERSPN